MEGRPLIQFMSTTKRKSHLLVEIGVVQIVIPRVQIAIRNNQQGEEDQQLEEEEDLRLEEEEDQQ